jgi:small subunit ribosomal protein S1
MDENKERPPEPSEETEDFATLFAESLKHEAKHREEVTAGEFVRGTVVGFDDEYVFVDIGAKSEAVLDITEMANEDGELVVTEGSPLEAYVVEVSEDGAIRLSHSLARRAQSRQLILEAARSGVPLEGRVEEAVKGGYRVAFGEGMRAFCPISQIDLAYTEEPQKHVGQTYRFVVTQVKEGGGDIVVSRKRLLEAEREEQAKKTRELLQPGARLTGTVRSIKPYGAFLDIGGVEGLLHVSEISHTRVAKPEDFVSVGQELEVVVKDYDTEKGRLSLTRKPLEADPWERVGTEFVEGGTYSGTVTRLADFGAFVELSPGLEGLLHISELSAGRRVRHPSEVLKVGEGMRVRIQGVDEERGRLSLTRVLGEDVENLPPLAPGAVYSGIVDGHAPFGVFVILPGGLGRGLLPKEESGTDRGADLAKEFPPGAAIEVQVLEVGQKEGKTRIRLSRRSLQEAKERAEVDSYNATQRQSQPSSPPLGRLGELLKEKGFRLKE